MQSRYGHLFDGFQNIPKLTNYLLPSASMALCSYLYSNICKFELKCICFSNFILSSLPEFRIMCFALLYLPQQLECILPQTKVHRVSENISVYRTGHPSLSTLIKCYASCKAA